MRERVGDGQGPRSRRKMGRVQEVGERWAVSKKWERDGRGPRSGREMGRVQEVEGRGVRPIGVEGRG